MRAGPISLCFEALKDSRPISAASPVRRDLPPRLNQFRLRSQLDHMVTRIETKFDQGKTQTFRPGPPHSYADHFQRHGSKLETLAGPRQVDPMDREKLFEDAKSLA